MSIGKLSHDKMLTIDFVDTLCNLGIATEAVFINALYIEFEKRHDK